MPAVRISYVLPLTSFFRKESVFMGIPNDPFILLSFVNTMLRDKYKNLDELCGDLDEDKNAIISKLADAGFEYDEKANKFC